MKVYTADQPQVFIYPGYGDGAKIVHVHGEPARLYVDKQLWESVDRTVRDDVLEGRMGFLAFMRHLHG